MAMVEEIVLVVLVYAAVGIVYLLLVCLSERTRGGSLSKSPLPPPPPPFHPKKTEKHEQ